MVPRNQSRLIRDLPLSDRSASASFRSTGSAMLGDFLMEELYSFVGEGWEQEDDITLGMCPVKCVNRLPLGPTSLSPPLTAAALSPPPRSSLAIDPALK